MKLAEGLRGRDFISLVDNTPEEVRYLMDLSDRDEREDEKRGTRPAAEGKTLSMIFEMVDAHTFRLVGMYEFSGPTLFLSKNDLQLGRGETMLGYGPYNVARYLDGIMIRTYAHRNVIDLARSSTIPSSTV